jgi:voltage-gated potassium channel
MTWADLLLLVPLSRCNEIFCAFLQDPFSRLRRDPQRTFFTLQDRIGFLFRSYIEVALDFAIIYFFLPSAWFHRESGIAFRSIIDALYFSGVTITTVGFGDIVPSHPLAETLVLYEIGLGLVLVVIALATYLSEIGRATPQCRD